MIKSKLFLKNWLHIRWVSKGVQTFRAFAETSGQNSVILEENCALRLHSLMAHARAQHIPLKLAYL